MKAQRKPGEGFTNQAAMVIGLIGAYGIIGFCKLWDAIAALRHIMTKRS